MPSATKRKAREHEVRMHRLRVWGLVGGITVLALIGALVLAQGAPTSRPERRRAAPSR